MVCVTKMRKCGKMVFGHILPKGVGFLIRLIVGRAGSGKTTHIMHDIARRIKNGEKPLTLIVPEQYSHNAERQLLGIVGDSLSLHGEVLSFKRLASRVFEELGSGLPQLDAGGELLVLYQSLRAVADRLEIYGESQKRVQFLSALHSTITELRSSAISSEALFEAADDNGALSKKLRDLGLILEAFEAQLGASGKYDACSSLLRLSEAAADSSYANGALYFDGFNDFTEPEMRVIEAFTRAGTEMTFCITAEQLDSDNDAFRLPCDTASRLILLASDNGEPCHIEYFDGDGERPDELLQLEAGLFGEAEAFEGSCTAVQIFCAPDAEAECEYAAALVKRLVRSGVRYGDIAVLSHGSEAYSRLCENVFSRYDIPSFRTGRDDIADKPPVVLILSALSILTSRWEYEDVFAYLKTGLAGIDSESLDKLEDFVFRRGIRGSLWLRETQWYGASDEIDAIRRRVISPLLKLSKALETSDTAGDMLRALYAFLEEIELPASLQERARELRDAGHERLADEYLQLWDIIVHVLDQMYLTTEAMRLGVHEFSHLLKLQLSCSDVGVIPVALDRVTIGDTAMSRRRNLRALILLGATDANIPRLSSQSGVLSAAERDSLVKSMKLKSLDSSEKLLTREFNIIYSALTMPSEQLFVIYNGAPGARPAFIIDRLESMLSIAPQQLQKTELIPEAELSVMRAAKAPESRGALSEGTSAALYGEHLRLSATRAESFNSCKFAFFMQNGLAARPRETENFDAPQAGTFIHYILEHTAAEAASRGGFKAVSEDEVRLLTRRLTARFISKNYPDFNDRTERFRYLLRRLSRDAENIALDLAGELSCSSFLPLRFEAQFNAEVPDADMSVSGVIDRVDGWNGNGRLYLRVSDYKTGRREFSLSDVFYGLGMQMLIYLYALGLDALNNALPAGALYTPARDELFSASKNEPDEIIEAALAKRLKRHGLLLADDDVINAMESSEKKLYLPVKVSGGGFTGASLVTLEQFGQLRRHVEKKLRDIAIELKSGRIDADPYLKGGDDNACRYCKFSSACGFGSLPSDGYRQLRTLRGDDFWSALTAESEVYNG